MARIVRGQVLSLKHQTFVEAARALGATDAAIIFRHIVPNTLGPVIVYTTLTVPAVILQEAFLSFLGLGVQPPNASWGTLVSDGARLLALFPWLVLFPSLAMSLTLLAFNFLGDGLRDALDPQGRGTPGCDARPCRPAWTPGIAGNPSFLSPCLPRGASATLPSVTDMSKPSDLVQGTLDLLILKLLALEPMHGWAISRRLKTVSGDVLQVSEGSLYPALHKLEQGGWITAEWKQTENNRRAKFYALTAPGRKQLEQESASWDLLSSAITRVVRLSEA
jgi:transcriptional regulator